MSSYAAKESNQNATNSANSARVSEPLASKQTFFEPRPNHVTDASARQFKSNSDRLWDLNTRVNTGTATETTQRVEKEEPLQGMFQLVQRAQKEEEPLQGKFETAQRASKYGSSNDKPFDFNSRVIVQRVDKEEPLQGKFDFNAPVQLERSAPKPNNTGLPDNLKSGIENLSGISMDNVKVHYNSLQPAQLNALAYAQGTDIHVAPGQEQHLPHEAWHVVQQAQGRVKPTMQMKDGVPVNDDMGLEHEADVMGGKAKQGNVGILDLPPSAIQLTTIVDGLSHSQQNPVQRVSMRTVRDHLSDRPKLLNVFRYWIRWSVKNTEREYKDYSVDGRMKYKDAAEFLDDHSLSEIVESLQVWAQKGNFEFLRNSESELDEPTEQLYPKVPNQAELKGGNVDKLSQAEHLRLARQEVTGAGSMIRKMSKVEATIFSNPKTSSNIDVLRPKGLLNNDAFPVERSIAFSLDSKHSFGDSSRNNDKEAYSITLRITLSPELKEFLENTLWNTNRSGGYANNPQFKVEHGKYNIIIPETGWVAFWRIAIKTAELENYKSPEEEWYENYLLMKSDKKGILVGSPEITWGSF